MNFHTHRLSLHQFASGSPIVLTAYDSAQLSADMAAPFQQEASFWWAAGIEEAGWKMIIDTTRAHTTLVRPERSDVQRTFDGETSDKDILTRSGADEIIEAQEFEQALRKLARSHTLVYEIYDKTPREFVVNPAQRTLHEMLTRIFASVESIEKHVHELRAIKSEEEIKSIKQAIALTVRAFTEVRKELEGYTHEYEVEAEFTKKFRSSNATHAYEPIVAAGSHAVTLHYTANGSKFGTKDLLLIDIGARMNGYCADITRTYALKPSNRQKQVHAAVVRAHTRIIKLLGPDVLVGDYITKVDEIMKEALIELGLLKDSNDIDTYRRYFPHAISHGLGIDVHDSLGAPRYFRPGMVLTVEPGIYIAEEGIGVRIEDDILITANGAQNLSRRLSTDL
ncbi:MAG: aminopeptidase P N-terminal domain-containing protein [Candidatus Saccharimonas sp.]